MWFGLLGPLKVELAGRPVPIGRRRDRAVLGILLLALGKVVTTERLIDLLWDGEPPAQAHRAIHAHVSRLRSSLSGHAAITSKGGGYLLDAAPAEVDANLFQTLVAEAGQEVAAERRTALLQQALGLWRGPVLVDSLSATLRERLCAGLEEARLTATEDWLSAELDLGHERERLAELVRLAAEHPDRERLAELHMLALHRSGRTGAALEVYAGVRGRLAENHGLDPGRRLAELHLAILRADPGLETPAVQPRELPADVRRFTGRAAELRAVEDVMTGEDRPLFAVHGVGGIGKSAFALHAAHRLAGHFPDGQLYVDLHGATPDLPALRPLEVLGRFLRSLGMAPAAVPSEVEEAAARFRSATVARRLLVVLDNARSVEQVGPLLPGGAGCGVLVTSRKVLTGLPASHHLHLRPLSATESVDLLGGLLGQERVAAEPEAAAELARFCGDLPLALRIVGARLTARPGWRLAELSVRLADARLRLDELDLEPSVRGSFLASYQELQSGADPTDRLADEAFRLVGLLDGHDLGLAPAARLLDLPQEEARRALERLVDIGLLESPASGRYHLHDLLRLYARELSTTTIPIEAREAAVARVFEHYVCVARGPGRLLDERANLLAAVEQASADPVRHGSAVIALARALYRPFVIGGHWRDLGTVSTALLEVARRLGDRPAEGRALNDLGLAHHRQGRPGLACDLLEQSLALRLELADDRGAAITLTNLGAVYELRGRYEEAMDCQLSALALHEKLDDRPGAAAATNQIGLLHQRHRRFAEALACHGRSLAAFRELGHRRGEALSLLELGSVRSQMDEHEAALALLHQARTAFAEPANRPGLAYCLLYLGQTHRKMGEPERAGHYLADALELFKKIGEPRGQAHSLMELGRTLDDETLRAEAELLYERLD
ncbi:tetratricopeptide repeat protein [Nonomuraea sp. NPDC050556]|uniref:AfsR/SARP family transcriptional regulator n=1 Tax=Nonomuraea sp. NPDC050556 TaxID=3364369 RepID=UPI003794CE24